ncbi:trypsin Blo t 3-like [Drosophila montana]|uniref:trypsin Blo t 3-like n=1 Tax=Drosophila montana TaxID=40370 RepID=UPI00313C0D30
MQHRNFSVLDILLLYLLLEANMRADSKTVERTKRLTSALKNEQTTMVAKYVVSIRSNKPQIIFGDNHFCVGSIVAPRFVLTAAKCTMTNRKVKHTLRSIVVVGGTPNRLISVKDTVTKKVQRVFVSDKYIKRSTNNIALLKLEGSWPTDNPSIQIISLPKGAPNYGISYMVLGWGRMFKGGPLTGNLVHVFVKLMDRKTCLSMVKTLYPEMLCAGNFDVDGDNSPCAGDTGGPMIDSNNTLVAIVSHRLGCGSWSTPSLYTDVWYHMEWINDTITNASSPTAARCCILLFMFSLIFLTVK